MTSLTSGTICDLPLVGVFVLERARSPLQHLLFTWEPTKDVLPELADSGTNTASPSELPAKLLYQLLIATSGLRLR